MFDLEESLKPLCGQIFATFKELRPSLDAIRLEHLSDLSPDFDAKEIYRIARQSGWIREDGTGRLSVCEFFRGQRYRSNYDLKRVVVVVHVGDTDCVCDPNQVWDRGKKRRRTMLSFTNMKKNWTLIVEDP